MYRMVKNDTYARRMGEGGDYWQEEIEDLHRDKILSLDFAQLILGDCLGRGLSRSVFDYKPKPGYVIKLEHPGYNCNVLEWEIWRQIEEYTKMNKWFAPVAEISPNGRILIQKKARIDYSGKGYPDKIPQFLWDAKPGNFGFIGKQFVCVDYGFTSLLELNDNGRMKKIDWQNR